MTGFSLISGFEKEIIRLPNNKYYGQVSHFIDGRQMIQKSRI